MNGNFEWLVSEWHHCRHSIDDSQDTLQCSNIVTKQWMVVVPFLSWKHGAVFLPLINWSRNEPVPPSWNNRALAYISFVFAYYFPMIRLSEAVCNCLPEWVMKVNIYRSIDSTNEMDCGRERSLSCSVHECNWRIWKQRRFICILVSVWNVCSAQFWVFAIQLILSHSHSLHTFFLNSECIHLCIH